MEAIADIPHVAETAPARRPPKPSHRSRVTNGSKLLPLTDERSVSARRFRDLFQ